VPGLQADQGGGVTTLRVKPEEVPVVMKEYPRGRIDWYEDGRVFANIPDAVYLTSGDDDQEDAA
jgi:hypothetical protein